MKLQTKRQVHLICLIVDWFFGIWIILGMLFGMSTHNQLLMLGMNQWFLLSIAVINVYIFGWKYINRTYLEIFKWKRIGMNLLIFLSTQLAMFFSVYELILKLQPDVLEVCIFVILFVQTGDLINDFLKRQINNDLKSIQTLQPTHACVLINKKYQEVKITEVKINDFIIVKTNEIIPTDGILQSTKALVDAQIINGEINGKTLSINDNVFAGMRNLGEPFIFQVNALAKDNLINQLIYKIQKIQTEKSKLQSIVDRLLVWFTPLVIFCAIIGLLLSLFVFKQSTHQAIKTMVTVLVSACPCALGIATPLAVLIGSSKAAKHGIIFNKPDAFSKLTNITTIAFDKTGTLTKGEIELVEYLGDDNYLAIIGSFEKQVKHPIAAGLIKYLNTKNIDYSLELSAVNLEDMSFKYLNDEYKIVKINPTHLAITDPFQVKQTVHTSSLVFKNDQLVAQLIFQDRLRDNVLAKIAQLHQQNYQVMMLTGDNFASANETAKLLKIDYVYADMTPETKKQVIADLQAKNEKVLFVGDGFNDVLAISQADLSIGIVSSSAYLDLNADLALLNGDISLIVSAIKYVKQTKWIIYSNLFWAFTYNFIIIPLALIGILTPMIGMIAMFCSTLLVLLNSLAFKLKK